MNRSAGICVPLFSLRSSRSWGLGEICDIPDIARWLQAAHHSVLQILPLNELAPGESSPYSALSAMAIDPRFITIGAVKDGSNFDSRWHDEIEALRHARRINYTAVSELKGRALHACFEQFYETEWLAGSERGEALRSFIHNEAWWLDEYSLYRAIRANHGETPWTEWPLELRNREPAAVADARARLANKILFYQYIQWVAAEQWDHVRQKVNGVEILGDFPFMVTLDSADVWSRQREFLLDASVGTPPDAFSKSGQEWGLPPHNWDEARLNNFEWLRMRARRLANLYDGFRVDHVVGFYRTYVRPLDGRPPYFSPAAESDQVELGELIMGIMKETGADVSVEDLGTVPKFVRASLAGLGLPGYRVFRWEPEDPATYPALSIAMTSTHDTEPLAAWWETMVPDDRQLFAQMPSIQVDPAPAFEPSTRDAILRAMYNAGSNLTLLSIQDVFGWRDRINHPATIGDWNWTYVLPWAVDRMAHEPEGVDAINRMKQWSDQSGRWREVPAQ